MSSITLRIHRLDKSLPLPAYQTSGSVAFDLASRVDMVIAPREIVNVPTGYIVEVPKGYGLFIFSRSGLPVKFGLTLPHSVGVIDSDYRGPADELSIRVMNITDKPVNVKRGDRLAQALLLPVPHVEFEEINEVTAPSRGGFGSTGK